MATFTRTYTFTVGTKAKAAEVNQNFSEISTFLNNSVVHVDGSKAFTGIPTLATGIDPTTSNHLTRKAYVDAKETSLTTAINQRLKQLNVSGVAVGTAPTVSSTQFKVLAGVATLAAGSGEFTVTFPTTDSTAGFAGGVVSIVATVTGSSTYEAGTPNAWVRIGAQSKTAFSGIVLQPGSVFGVTGPVPFTSTCKVNWIAVGW
jgi:hypothetical protein